MNDSIATINNKLISIVERGVKNGYNYIKYSNGDAVVWRKYTWNTDVSVSWYGLYFVSSKAVDFPFAFKEAPLIIVSPGTTNELYWMGVNEVSTTGYKLTAYSVKKGINDVFPVSPFAIPVSIISPTNIPHRDGE